MQSTFEYQYVHIFKSYINIYKFIISWNSWALAYPGKDFIKYSLPMNLAIPKHIFSYNKIVWYHILYVYNMNLVLQEVFEMSTKEDKWDHVKHMPYANEDKFPIPIGPYHSNSKKS